MALASAALGERQHLGQVIDQEVWERDMCGNRAFQSFHVCRGIKKAKRLSHTEAYPGLLLSRGLNENIENLFL